MLIYLEEIATMAGRDNYKITIYEILESIGLILIHFKKSEIFFVLPPGDDDDYVRYFIPQFKSYHKERVLLGYVGSLDKKILLPTNDNISFCDYVIISVMTVNFPGLMNPPFIGKSNDDDLHWCRLIKNVVDNFPKDKNHLEIILTERKSICGLRVDKRDVSRSFFQ